MPLVLSVPFVPCILPTNRTPAGGLYLTGDELLNSGVTVSGSVLFRSYDTDTVKVVTSGNTLTNNMALGTFKASATLRPPRARSPFSPANPASPPWGSLCVHGHGWGAWQLPAQRVRARVAVVARRL